MPSPESQTRPLSRAALDISSPSFVSGSFRNYSDHPGLASGGFLPISLQVVSNVPTRAYQNMLKRVELDRQTNREIKQYLGLTASTPVTFDAYARVTLLGNQPYYPGYAMVTEARFGNDFAQRVDIITTDTERPFSGAVTDHIGLRVQAAGWVRRHVIDIDAMAGDEMADLQRNLAMVYEMPRLSTTVSPMDQQDRKSA